MMLTCDATPPTSSDLRSEPVRFAAVTGRVVRIIKSQASVDVAVRAHAPPGDTDARVTRRSGAAVRAAASAQPLVPKSTSRKRQTSYDPVSCSVSFLSSDIPFDDKRDTLKTSVRYAPWLHCTSE